MKTFIVAALLAVSAAAPPQVLDSYVFSPSGHLAPLRAGVTYQAHAFPFPIRVTPPAAGWNAAQWKANIFSPEQIAYRHLTCNSNPKVCAPPYYGWLALGSGGTNPNVPPRALILVMGGYQKTPSVAAAVRSVRTRGHGVEFEPSTPVTVAGFSGVQLDGHLTGERHVFVPFSPRTNKATGFPDGIEENGAGHAFRFYVLDVHGHTVVVFIGSEVLTADEFDAFLPSADAVLQTLRFP